MTRHYNEHDIRFWRGVVPSKYYCLLSESGPIRPPQEKGDEKTTDENEIARMGDLMRAVLEVYKKTMSAGEFQDNIDRQTSVLKNAIEDGKAKGLSRGDVMKRLVQQSSENESIDAVFLFGAIVDIELKAIFADPDNLDGLSKGPLFEILVKVPLGLVLMSMVHCHKHLKVLLGEAKFNEEVKLYLDWIKDRRGPGISPTSIVVDYFNTLPPGETQGKDKAWLYAAAVEMTKTGDAKGSGFESMIEKMKNRMSQEGFKKSSPISYTHFDVGFDETSKLGKEMFASPDSTVIKTELPAAKSVSERCKAAYDLLKAIIPHDEFSLKLGWFKNLVHQEGCRQGTYLTAMCILTARIKPQEDAVWVFAAAHILCPEGEGAFSAWRR